MSDQSTSKARQLVAKAGELFFAHGIRRISIEEICREAGVSKMTFYKHFPNKTAIARQIIEELWDEWLAVIRRVKSGSEPFEERIREILHFRLEHSRRFSREFMAELMSGCDPELNACFEERMSTCLSEIRELFVEAQESGQIRSDIRVDFLVYMMTKMKDIHTDSKLLDLYADRAELIKDAFTFFYYGALSREGENDEASD